MKTKYSQILTVFTFTLSVGIAPLLLAQDKNPAPEAKPDNVDSKMFYHQTSAFKGHEGSVRGLDWSPDGKMLASCGDEKIIRIWELPD